MLTPQTHAGLLLLNLGHVSPRGWALIVSLGCRPIAARKSSLQCAWRPACRSTTGVFFLINQQDIDPITARRPSGWFGGLRKTTAERKTERSMQFILKGKSLDKETRRYLCQIECPSCGYARTVWFAGWSALMCAGCKLFISRPEAKR